MSETYASQSGGVQGGAAAAINNYGEVGDGDRGEKEIEGDRVSGARSGARRGHVIEAREAREAYMEHFGRSSVNERDRDRGAAGWPRDRGQGEWRSESGEPHHGWWRAGHGEPGERGGAVVAYASCNFFTMFSISSAAALRLSYDRSPSRATTSLGSTSDIGILVVSRARDH